MKTHNKLLIIGFVIIAFLAFIGNARALTPTLSLTLAGGSGSNVLISVSGDPNSSVVLYYNVLSGANSIILGNTNNVGYLSTTIDSNSYGILPNGTVYVKVNNQQSSSMSWPSYSSSYSSFTLSQNNISLSVGQTTLVNAYNNYGSIYLSINTNSNVATATVNGNTISVFGRSAGNANMTFCQNNNSSYCSTLYISVNGNSISVNPNNSLGLNISNLILPVGGSMTLSPSGVYGGIYLSNNSNPDIVSVTSSSLIPGCTSNSQYSVTTGQSCWNYNYNTGFTGYSSVLGCTGNSQYSVLTGQPCYSSVNNGSGSVVVLARSLGTGMFTLCQSGGSSCTSVNITVY